MYPLNARYLPRGVDTQNSGRDANIRDLSHARHTPGHREKQMPPRYGDTQAVYERKGICRPLKAVLTLAHRLKLAVIYKPELGFRVGLWYYYEQNERENGKAYLQFAAERGDTAAEEALKAINNGVNARLLSGVLNLFRHASRVIDDRAKAYAKSGMMQGVDKKLREQIRQKKEGLGMRMG